MSILTENFDKAEDIFIQHMKGLLEGKTVREVTGNPVRSGVPDNEDVISNYIRLRLEDEDGTESFVDIGIDYEENDMIVWEVDKEGKPIREHTVEE